MKTSLLFYSFLVIQNLCFEYNLLQHQIIKINEYKVYIGCFAYSILCSI